MKKSLLYKFVSSPLRIYFTSVLALILLIGSIAAAVEVQSRLERGRDQTLIQIPLEEDTVEPLMRVYVWEKYWDGEREERRVVEICEGETVTVGELWQYTPDNEYGIYSARRSKEVSPDKAEEFIRKGGSVSAFFDGPIEVEHSIGFAHDNMIYAECENYYLADRLWNDSNEIRTQHSVSVAYAYTAQGMGAWEKKGFEEYNTTEIEKLTDIYKGLPREYAGYSRKIATFTIFIRGYDDLNPDSVLAEARLRVKHYFEWTDPNGKDMITAYGIAEKLRADGFVTAAEDEYLWKPNRTIEMISYTQTDIWD